MVLEFVISYLVQEFVISYVVLEFVTSCVVLELVISCVVLEFVIYYVVLVNDNDGLQADAETESNTSPNLSLLQAICSHGTCHSTWADDYNRRTTVDSDNYPSQAAPVFSLDEVRAVHFRAPRIPEALARPSAILNTTSPTFAHIGRYVLQRSGRTDLLEG